jgi:hypothetical protein
MKELTDMELRGFARAGALAMCRLAIAEFPDILAALNAAAAPVRNTALTQKDLEVYRAAQQRKGGGWSPAKRKAHSIRMKKRWAARRRGK